MFRARGLPGGSPWEPAVKGACFSVEEKGRCIAVFIRENNTSTEERQPLLQASGETLESFLNGCDRGIKKKKSNILLYYRTYSQYGSEFHGRNPERKGRVCGTRPFHGGPMIQSCSLSGSWPSCLWQGLDDSAAFFSKFLRKIYLFLFHGHGCFSCMSECVPHASLVPMKTGKEPWIPWDWS